MGEISGFVLHARRNIGSALLVASVLVGVAVAQRAPAADTGQPLPMSHRRHLAKDMKCRACHQGVEGQALASFPSLADCMDCHKTRQGEDPDEPAVRAFAARAEELVWVRLNRLAGHVYFSHAAHVTLANMKCEDCHQDMKNVDKAPTQPDANMEMSDCVACHRAKHASLDCAACHK
jgi:menaquinone reductase, multiheme cytochrome c subunit